MNSKLRLVILGTMGRCPFAGQTWLYLNWLRAFSRLGCEVYYVEDDTVWPYDPEENTVSDNCRYATRHIARCMKQIGLPNQWAFRLADRKEACWGMSPKRLDELYRSCDALLNIVGATDLREEQLRAPYRIYVECDPVTAELRLANGDAHTDWAFGNHHLIFTYGENYGATDCRVPLNGLEAKYRKTRQPIDLDLWSVAYDPKARFFTTLGNYRQEGSDVEYQGEIYRWSKHHEWEKFIDLPRYLAQPFEAALNIASADRERLEGYGWKIISPFKMSLDIFGAYPEYIRQSRAEWTVAKDQNVRLRSGWFSERDVCYLASGKPVVAQDTGFSNLLPTGAGLFAFREQDEALQAIAAINRDYERHCRAARSIAEEFFSAPRVGAQLLKEANLSWNNQGRMPRPLCEIRHLIVNADDFGASRGVNRGIVVGHRQGIVTSASLMVTGRAREEAVALSRENPNLAIGLHFDVCGEDEREFDTSDIPATRDEFFRQLDAFVSTVGRMPTHIDSHRHVHLDDPGLFPHFQEWVEPLGIPLRGDGKVNFVGGFYAQWEWKVTELKYVSVPFLQEMLRNEVPPGFTEFSCHPGYVSEDYQSVYWAEREAELATLTDPRVRQTITEQQIRLISYADYARLVGRP